MNEMMIIMKYYSKRSNETRNDEWTNNKKVKINYDQIVRKYLLNKNGNKKELKKK